MAPAEFTLTQSLSASAAMCWREVVRFLRQRNRVIGALVQPLVFWGLFGLGLHRSFQLPGAEGQQSFSVYFYPGVILLMVMFTAIFATISIIEDRREGFLQSVLIAPAPRWTMVLGKVLGGSLLALGQALVLILLAWLAGVRPGAVSLMALALLLFLTSLGLTSMGVVLAWRMESTQGFHAIMNLLLMPMWLLSGAFFPAPTASDPSLAQTALHWIMRINPLTYAVAETRRLLYGATPAGFWTPQAWVSWVALTVFAAAAFSARRIAAQRRRCSQMKKFIVLGAALMLAIGGAVIYGAWKLQQTRGVNSVTVADEQWKGVPSDAAQPILESFTLTAQNGQPLGSKDLEGKVWVANFFFATCPGSCRQQSEQVNQLREEFGDAGVKFVSISCDPAEDSPEKLAEYAKQFITQPDQWYFLTGDMTYIRRVGAEYFQLLVQEKTHQDRLVLVDQNGEIQGRYNWHEEAELKLLKKKLAELTSAVS